MRASSLHDVELAVFGRFQTPPPPPGRTNSWLLYWKTGVKQLLVASPWLVWVKQRLLADRQPSPV